MALKIRRVRKRATEGSRFYLSFVVDKQYERLGFVVFHCFDGDVLQLNRLSLMNKLFREVIVSEVDLVIYLRYDALVIICV